MTKFGFCRCTSRSGEIELGPIKNGTSSSSTVALGEEKRYTCFQNVKNYFLEYCSEGSLHGIKYIGERRTIVEKIWWVISMTVSLYFCVTLTLATYDKWENAPVIVSFATKETPMWQVPFPVVTLCPETKARPTAFNFTKYLFQRRKNITLDQETEKKFAYLSLLCQQHSGFDYESDSLYAGEDMFDFFDEVQPKFYEDVFECRFMGSKQNCSDIWRPMMTNEGICYVFNLLDRHDLFKDNVVHYKNYHSFPKSDGWSLEHGYPLSSGKETYPQRALFPGASYALEVKISIYEEDMDYYCGSSVQGYKVQISHPSRIPMVRGQHFLLPVDQLVIAAVVPDMMTTSEAVKNYNPARRNCYFPSERHLQYFKLYSQANCNIECQSNYTKHKCGCVNFYMPRDNSTLVCGAKNLNCMRNAIHELMFEGIDKKVRKLRGEKHLYNKNKWLNCDCLPICTSMYYIVENSQSHWDWRKKFETDEPHRNTQTANNTRKRHMSYLQVFFKANQFITSERNELFGPTDFLANFGGLLGLFVGFSLLSFIEVVYYLSLRIICNICMFGSSNWSGKNK